MEITNQTMPDYNPIKHERLRQLVILSESLNSLPEDQLQATVTRIGGLAGPDLEAMVKVLEDEQRLIEANKRARGLTPEMELAEIEERRSKVVAIKRDFESAVNRENERVDTVESSKAAEDALKDLDNL